MANARVPARPAARGGDRRTRQIKYEPGRWMSFQLISCKRELRWSEVEVCPFVNATAMCTSSSSVVD